MPTSGWCVTCLLRVAVGWGSRTKLEKTHSQLEMTVSPTTAGVFL